MLATIPFAEAIGWQKGEILGYTTIVLSALMVFFGVRSYRENVGGGRLTFGRGFAVGIWNASNLVFRSIRLNNGATPITASSCQTAINI